MVRWLPQGYEEKPPARIWAGGLYREARSRIWRHAVPRLRFVIIAKGRTGSTLLTTSLDSHPDLICADEILNRPQIDALRYADRYARRVRSDGFGFHIKPDQIIRVQGFRDLTTFARRMAESGWKIVHLQRRDVVAQYVSVLRGLQSREWHRSTSKRPGSTPKLHVDVDDFLSRIQKRRAGFGRERAALSGVDTFHLVYEDDLRRPEDRTRRLEALQSWLGLPVRALESPLRKIADRDPLDVLANAEAVRAALIREGLLE